MVCGKGCMSVGMALFWCDCASDLLEGVAASEWLVLSGGVGISLDRSEWFLVVMGGFWFLFDLFTLKMAI